MDTATTTKPQRLRQGERLDPGGHRTDSPTSGRRPGPVPDHAAAPGRVSFVVVNWRNEDATADCVRSLSRLIGGHEIEVIVVDNASTPASRAALAELDRVTVVANAENLGFAGGVNSGVAVATGEFIALVNNDLVVDPGWLEAGIRALGGADVAVAGGKEFFLDDANPAYDTANRFDGAPFIHPDHGFVLRTGLDPAESRDVAYVSGCNLLIRTAEFRAAGGLDQAFFAYYEEADLCARLMARGRRIVYTNRMRVWHRRNRSSDRIPFRKHYLPNRNHLRFVARHFPAGEWRRKVAELILQDAWFAVCGRQGGLRAWRTAPRIPPIRRGALMATALWGLTHARALAQARREVISAGQHDAAYRAKLRRQPHLSGRGPGGDGPPEPPAPTLSGPQVGFLLQASWALAGG